MRTSLVSSNDGGHPLNGGGHPDRSQPRASDSARPRRLLNVDVLVVEDDAPSAKLLAALLAIEGATVKVVQTAEEALAAVPAFPARLMIVDLILPRMSGLLLVEQMKAAASTRDIIAIAVSAVNGPEAERVALRSGCAAYLRKPIDIDTLIDLIISTLQGRS